MLSRAPPCVRSTAFTSSVLRTANAHLLFSPRTLPSILSYRFARSYATNNAPSVKKLSDEELWKLLDDDVSSDTQFQPKPRESKAFTPNRGSGFNTSKGSVSNTRNFNSNVDFDIPKGPAAKNTGNFNSDMDFNIPKGPAFKGGRTGGNFSSDQELGANLRDYDWDTLLQKLPKFEKNFYKEHPDLAKMSASEAEALRRSFNPPLFVSGKEPIPKPVRTFEEAMLPPFVMNALSKLNFTTPTPIQSQGIPIALSGRDIIGLAETGSGKTLAFLIPALVHLKAQPPVRAGEGPVVLVLAPTRELALQITEEGTRIAGRPPTASLATLYGGAGRTGQMNQLKRNPSIVVATPGRLIDMISAGATNLQRVTYLVIDEADRMLDMGFEPQLRQIVSQIRPDRQTLMWSATWPTEVRQLAMSFLVDPVLARANSGELSANPNVEQRFTDIGTSGELGKKRALFKVLEELREKSTLPCGLDRVLVFCNTKRSASDLTDLLNRNGWPATVIHGDKAQTSRETALRAFREGSTPILVATDVAARGIDVKDIACVINFDLPRTTEDYIHRIGRTGRAGAKGIAHSFFTEEDASIADSLVKVIREAKQQPPEFLSSYRKGGDNKQSASFRTRGWTPSQNRFGNGGSFGFGRGPMGGRNPYRDQRSQRRPDASRERYGSFGSAERSKLDTARIEKLLNS